MKRSEMIKLMVENAKYHDGSYLEPYAADSLLSAMEDEGMLPPPEYHEQDRDAKVTCNKAKMWMKWELEDDN